MGAGISSFMPVVCTTGPKSSESGGNWQVSRAPFFKHARAGNDITEAIKAISGVRIFLSLYSDFLVFPVHDVFTPRQYDPTMLILKR
jgi:hypothetical protein